MIRRAWVPVLVALLVAALVGPVGGEVTAVEPRVVFRTITIPAAVFSPSHDDWDFSNHGWGLWLDSGSGDFIAPLFFEAREVRIKSMTLYARDNGGESVCLTMYRSIPPDGIEEAMGQVCSSGGSEDIRAFTQSSFTYRRITGAYGPYLWVTLPGPDGDWYELHGVKVTYSYETS